MGVVCYEGNYNLNFSARTEIALSYLQFLATLRAVMPHEEERRLQKKKQKLPRIIVEDSKRNHAEGTRLLVGRALRRRGK